MVAVVHQTPQAWISMQKLGEAVHPLTEEHVAIYIVNGNIPMIEHVNTGRQWVLDWPSIVDQAQAAFDDPANAKVMQ